MSKFPFIFSAGLIPIMLWGAYFYAKNPRKQPIREIIKIFILGMFSIVPVIIFDKWFSRQFIGELQEIWPFLNHLLAHAILQLGLLILFIITFVLLFTVINAIGLKCFYHLKWSKTFAILYNKLYSLSPILIFFSIFLIIEVAFNLGKAESFILSFAGSSIIFAISEEYFKYIINPFLVYKKIHSVGNAMVNALYVGLAFAFVENILFFYFSFGSDQFTNLFLYRSFFTTLLHVGTSGILGYFYGISLFSESMLTNYEIEKSEYHIPIFLRKSANKESIFKSISITQGFFLAALLHALFNLLLNLQVSGTLNIALTKVLPAALAVFLAITVTLLIRSKNCQIQYGLIGSKAMPEADFEKLRLQISVLQHTKEIQKANQTEAKTSGKL